MKSHQIPASLIPTSLIAASIVAGLATSLVPSALAKPPLQLSGPGVRVEPLAIATARIENGTFVFGEWQEYRAQTRSEQGYFYLFDCYGGYLPESVGEYVNAGHAGQGARPGELRWPGEGEHGPCGLGSARWYFGPTYINPLSVEDITETASGSEGGIPIDAMDVAFYWGGGECVIAILTSDAPCACNAGDPFDHPFYAGVAINLGEWEPGGMYIVNIDGIWSTHGMYVRLPQRDGSYAAALLNPDGSLNVNPGTQFMLWGTGDIQGDRYRAGAQLTHAWDDDAPTNGLFGRNECYVYDYGACPIVMGKCIGLLGTRCAADLNWDGFVNADDFDLFAAWFESASSWNASADLNCDYYVNADDFDLFAAHFEEGC